MNKVREKERTFRQKNMNVLLRKLDFAEDTNALCEKGTDEQKEYYKTGDQEKIEINDDKIESKDNPEYVRALINLIAGTNDSTENLTNYIKHLIPVLIFFVIAILSLPGWLICCICNCCNCCCCCCCKKTSCKFPFYIITSVIYALIAGINIYGLSQSNSIFVGLADIECSILKFIGEVLDGESKETKPKWDGISNIQKLFGDTKTEVDKIIHDNDHQIDYQKTLVDIEKGKFKKEMKDQSQQIYVTTDSYHKVDNYYILDLIQGFGKYDCSVSTINCHSTCTSGDTLCSEYCPSGVSSYIKCEEVSSEPSDSLMDGWNKEYKGTANELDKIMTTVETNYKDLHTNSDALNALDEGVKSMGDLRTTFDDVKDQISGAIIDYSDTIDQYGKLAFKLVFSVLLIIDVGIAAFITLLFFCSFKTCQNCCLKCLFKSLLHILWNILALLNFFTLLFGSFFTLFGTIGKDLIPVVEYLVSDENLNQQEPLLLGSAKQYLKQCINGDGNIVKELGLDTKSLESIDELSKIKDDIDKLKIEIDRESGRRAAYTIYNNIFTDIIGYNEDFSIVGGSISPLKFSTVRGELNRDQTRINWALSCESEYTECKTENLPALQSTSIADKCVIVKKCETDVLTSVYGSGDPLQQKAKELNYFITLVNREKSASDATSDDDNSIQSALQSLNDKYTNFINQEKNTLNIFESKIGSLTSLFKDKLGTGNIYSILNCKFIGRNVKIILKYLKKALGKNVYNVGVCLLTAGVSMSLSIAFTILLNIIFNLQKPTPAPERRINYAS